MILVDMQRTKVSFGPLIKCAPGFFRGFLKFESLMYPFKHIFKFNSNMSLF